MASPDRPLRIGIVSPYSLTIPGGVQAQVLGLARVLRSMGHEARVLGPCDGPPPATWVTPLGNSIPLAANGSVAPLAPDFSAALRTIRALRDEDFDVIHLHEPLVPGPTVTSLIMHPAPIVATFHAAGDSTSYRLLNAPLRRLTQNISIRCVVSKDASALVKGYLGGEYEVLFNGVEIERYQAGQTFKGDAPAIFFCGRHEPRKGLEVLLKALALLPPDVECWIGSDGPATQELRIRFAGDVRIKWLGRLTDTEKIERLRGAAVFCAPSLMGESFGVVLIEAMAAGTPVVASALDGYKNVATNELDALLVTPDDHVALAGALRRVLVDAALTSRLVAAGSARAKSYSMRTLADKYVETYLRAIEHVRQADAAETRSSTGVAARRILSNLAATGRALGRRGERATRRFFRP
jgi:phosphatidyl-myo-inositol alpha-mannosyltransferase